MTAPAPNTTEPKLEPKNCEWWHVDRSDGPELARRIYITNNGKVIERSWEFTDNSEVWDCEETPCAPLSRVLSHDEATALQDALVAKAAEIARLREVVSKCAEATGAFISTEASVEFMEQLPTEISMNRTQAAKEAE